MGSPKYRIPETIQEGKSDYLNCESGSSKRPDKEVDEFVLSRFEMTFSDKYLQLYYKYPDVGRSDNDYIDIVALSPYFGCAVLVISNLKINEIEDTVGFDWKISGQSQSVRPTEVADSNKVAVRGMFESEGELRDEDNRSKVPTNEYVALPNITKSEWESKFGTANSNLLFKDTLESRTSLRERVFSEKANNLEEGLIRNALATLRFSNAISGGQLNVTANLDTKRDYIDYINRRLKILTSKQIKIGLQTPEGPQRIRGIAGSGKTVVMALKAAKLHNEEPNAKIALTFRNHGLRQTHRELVTKFYKILSYGDEPDWEKLDIIHGWGGKHTGEGMYYKVSNRVSDKLDNHPLTSTQARHKFGRFTDIPTRLNLCCEEVCDLDTLPKMYDAVLIDEAQDLPEYFYRMCWRVCGSKKRIYWAYDEAQNLSTLEARSTKGLFGTDSSGQARVDVSGKLEDGVSPSHVMRTAFRTPRSVLMTAHGFGMGLYRDGPVIQTITNQKGWDRIGYEIEDGCSFAKEGNQIIANRPIENSPHPLWEYQNPKDLVRVGWEDTWKEEIDWVVNDVKNMLEVEGVRPEEIMITHLWPYKKKTERVDYVIKRLEKECSSHGNSESITHRVSEEVSKRGGNAAFRSSGKITVSGVYYARGNEAEVVYVMGTDYAGEEASQERYPGSSWREKHVEARNKAFVLLTRSKGWCRITGTDPTHRIAGELNRVMADTLKEDPRLKFKVPPQDSPFKDLEPETIH